MDGHAFRLEEMWKKLDVDNRGMIGSNEIQIGLSLTDEDTASVLASLNIDRSGSITYQQFRTTQPSNSPIPHLPASLDSVYMLLSYSYACMYIYIYMYVYLCMCV